MRLLLVTHRLPWPPDKGERIRAYHLLRHLAGRFEVVLASVDDEHGGRVPPELAALCRRVHAVPLGRARSWWRIAAAFARRRAPSLELFADPRLCRLLAALPVPDVVLAISTAAALALPERWRIPRLFDMVDVDSAKWADLAAKARDPLRRWVFAREARLVAAAEVAAARRAVRVAFVAERERRLFARRHPELATRLRVVPNGVDVAAYEAACRAPDPYDGIPGRRLVFVGRMDYPPNVAAARLLAEQVLPRLVASGLDVHLHLVGAAPVRAVRRLAGPRVRVWGRVADVRPFQLHADVALVPLTVARGVQNKLLEAMAAGRPVVASPAAVEGLPAAARPVVAVAGDAEGIAREIALFLRDPVRARRFGDAARAFVAEHLGWPRAFAALDRLMDEVLADGRAVRPPAARARHCATR